MSGETVRVYFAEQARFAIVVRCEVVDRQLGQLMRDTDGVYLAVTRGDYLVLRPFERMVSR